MMSANVLNDKFKCYTPNFKVIYEFIDIEIICEEDFNNYHNTDVNSISGNVDEISTNKSRKCNGWTTFLSFV